MAGRERYPREYREETIRLARSSGKPARAIARELGIPPSTVTEWLREARAEETGEALTPDERAELRELRRRVRILEQEREILNKAAAFFAQENERIR